MLELVKLVLSAPSLNVALLCVVLALGVLLKREKGKNGSGNHPMPDAGVILSKQWFERVNEAAARTHQIAGLEGHRKWATEEIKELKATVAPLVTSQVRLTERVDNLDEKLDEMRRINEKATEEIRKTLDRHDEKLDRLLERLR